MHPLKKGIKILHQIHREFSGGRFWVGVRELSFGQIKMPRTHLEIEIKVIQ